MADWARRYRFERTQTDKRFVAAEDGRDVDFEVAGEAESLTDTLAVLMRRLGEDMPNVVELAFRAGFYVGRCDSVALIEKNRKAVTTNHGIHLEGGV